jgi:hypothetical protein
MGEGLWGRGYGGGVMGESVAAGYLYGEVGPTKDGEPPRTGEPPPLPSAPSQGRHRSGGRGPVLAPTRQAEHAPRGREARGGEGHLKDCEREDGEGGPRKEGEGGPEPRKDGEGGPSWKSWKMGEEGWRAASGKAPRGEWKPERSASCAS